MKAFVIMANDYPQGVHIGDEEGAAEEMKRLAAAYPYGSSHTVQHWRCCEFVPTQQAAAEDAADLKRLRAARALLIAYGIHDLDNVRLAFDIMTRHKEPPT